MEKNQEYKGKVLFLGTEGEGVIKYGDCTAFVPFCLEGEEVAFKALKVAGGVAYGKLTEVIVPSEGRRAPVCPAFERCGGCQLQHADYALQLQFKRGLVCSALKKIGGLDVPVEECVPSPEIYGYRNKLALPVGADADGNTLIGFYAPRSHRIVPVEECALQREWSAPLIGALAKFMNASRLKGYDERTGRGDIRHLVAREVEGRLIVTVVAPRPVKLQGFVKELESHFEKFSLWLNLNDSRGNAVFGEKWTKVCGEGFVCGEDCGVKFRAGANTFLQVNDGVRGRLYAAVLDEVRGISDVAIDLYSGGGMLTAMLAKACGCAYGVEIVKEAVACADGLRELNGLQGAMFNICGPVESEVGGVLERTAGRRRVIVCDPPRKGMERSVVREILKSGAERVVLVSCNPATLARDLGLLCGSLVEADGGVVKNCAYSPGSGAYKIDKVQPFDMFPQTKHVETLVVLTRN